MKETEKSRDNILEVRGVSKHFGRVQALDDVSLAFQRGEIHTLLGENGAGKTTLMNILYGLYQKDSGSVWVEGQQQEIRDPKHALQLGIGMVPQFFKLVSDMSVLENIYLFLRDKKLLIREKELVEKARELSDMFGFGLEERLQVEIADLSEGEKQKVEILKVLALGSKIILFDEATNVLAPNELDSFLKVIERLNREGYTILYITHRLQEALQISHRISVFRKGRLVGTIPGAEASYGQLTTMMVGTEFSGKYATKAGSRALPILQVSEVEAVDDRGLPALRNVGFELYPGEIVGLSGIEGNGCSQLAEVLMGLRAVKSGLIRFKGKDITRLACSSRMDCGMNYIPSADTQVPQFSIRKNSILDYPQRAPFSRRGLLSWRHVSEHAEKIVAAYQVQTPSIRLPTYKLSGGNRQRLALGRKIEANPELMIAYHPTKGLDINSQDFFYSRLALMRDQGTTVLFMSTDLDELFKICDRLMVIYRGQIVGVFDELGKVSKLEVGVLMTGGSQYAAKES